MSERAESEAGNQQADPELEYLQQLVRADRSTHFCFTCDHPAIFFAD